MCQRSLKRRNNIGQSRLKFFFLTRIKVTASLVSTKYSKSQTNETCTRYLKNKSRTHPQNDTSDYKNGVDKNDTSLRLWNLFLLFFSSATFWSATFAAMTMIVTLQSNEKKNRQVEQKRIHTKKLVWAQMRTFHILRIATQKKKKYNKIFDNTHAVPLPLPLPLPRHLHAQRLVVERYRSTRHTRDFLMLIPRPQAYMLTVLPILVNHLTFVCVCVCRNWNWK